MKPTSRALLISATLLAPSLVLANSDLPLQGEAWTQADLADRSYQNNRFGDALNEVNAALRLRPNVARLHLLKVYTLQKLGRPGEARKAAQVALDRGLKDPTLAAEARRPGAVAGSQSARPASAFQRGYPIATKAYNAFNANRLQDAQHLAEQAFRIDPGQGAWALLWLDALEAQQRWAEAESAASTAIALGAPNATDLDGRRQAHRRRQAIVPAEQAYQALAAGQTQHAAALARQAVSLAPDVATHRLLLVTALFQDGQIAAAETATSAALQEDPENTVMLVSRAYLRQLQGNAEAAREDFDEALAQDWLDQEQQRNLRLIAIDSALAAGNDSRAQALLEPMDTADAAVLKRHTQLGRTAPTRGALSVSRYPMPRLSCTDGFYGTQCEMLPADTQGGAASPASQAYAAYARRDYRHAIEQARLAVEQAPENAQWQRLLTTTLAAGNNAQQKEAEQRLTQEIAQAPENAELLMQRGYLRQQMHQPRLAHADFQAARRTGNAPRTVVLDEAYALSAMGDNPGAVRKFKHAIDMDDAGTLDLDEEQRYNTRSTIAGLDRQWGATLSLNYRGAQPTTSIDGAAQNTAGDSLSSTAEAYWRPTQLHNRHGMLEVYGRLTHTLYDEGSTYKADQYDDPCSGESSATNGESSTSRSITGWPSTVGALGVRYQLTNLGLGFGLERRFFLGSATRQGSVYPASNSDRCELQGRLVRYKQDSSAGSWLTYATYGFYRGTELRPGQSSWWTTSFYAQLGLIMENNAATFTLHEQNANGEAGKQVGSENGRLLRNQLFLSQELRWGRSFRFDTLPPNLVWFPHLVATADWNRQKDQAQTEDGERIALTRDPQRWSLSTGPGVAARYWFREDHYNVPRSYLEGSVQYRLPIGGGTERAKGLFMNLTLSY